MSVVLLGCLDSIFRILLSGHASIEFIQLFFRQHAVIVGIYLQERGSELFVGILTILFDYTDSMVRSEHFRKELFGLFPVDHRIVVLVVLGKDIVYHFENFRILR